MIKRGVIPVAKVVKKKKTPKPVSIQEMVVTSTRSERSLDEVVPQVSVVDKKEIKKLPVVLWDDALKYQGGIWIRKTRDLSMASVMNMPAIRGVGGSGNNLLLLDGFPIMNRKALNSALSKWRDLFEEQGEENPFADLDVYVVPFDVHY